MSKFSNFINIFLDKKEKQNQIQDKIDKSKIKSEWNNQREHLKKDNLKIKEWLEHEDDVIQALKPSRWIV